MAGAGIKLFVDGEILSADELNFYLMDQVVTVFDDETDRNNAFGGAGEPTLSEGRICYLRSTNAVQVYDGSNWNDSGQFTVADGTITTAKLDGTGGSEAVTTAKIRNLAVTTAKINDAAVTTAKLGSGLTLSGKTTISGTIALDEILETVNYSAGTVSASQNIDILSGTVYYFAGTASTPTTVTPNFRGDGSNTLASQLAVGQSVTCVLIYANGSAARGQGTINIDGSTSNITTLWFGGASPLAETSSATYLYTYSIIKTATGPDTYTVFANQSKYGA
jgi:hypothetical protein